MAIEARVEDKARASIGRKLNGDSMADPSERESSAEEIKIWSEYPPPSKTKTGTKKSKDQKSTAAAK